MPRISNIQLLKRPQTTIIAIRTRTPVEKLPQIIGESYGKIAQYILSQNELMSDAPFVLYHNMDMQDLDVEMGFPIAAPLPDKDDMHCRVLPEAKAIMCMYLGEYSQMEPTYQEMMQWIEAHAMASDGEAIEYYYNDPGFPKEQWLTQIVLTLK